MTKISAVINTRNEEKNLPRVISSVKPFVDEIVVVDMESDDKTREVAKKLGAKVYSHKMVGYVEPARNYAISKARFEWILIIDADEEISKSLGKKIREIASAPSADYYRIPRKNIIFNKWLKNSRWWPDFNIRFFKKGYVSWNEVIHSVPMTQGVGAELDPKEDLAIIHHNYDSIEDYLDRMAKYTSIQANLLISNKYVFSWTDIVKKPLSEFLGRYFAGQGYKDGLHGLAVSLLQAFSEIIVYLKVWGKEGYKEEDIEKNEIKKTLNYFIAEISWWIRKEFSWLKFPKLH